MQRRRCTVTSQRRRGAVMVFTLVMIFVLLGFASLTLDVGALYGVRGDLQNAADAAALSGASMFASDAMAKVRENSSVSFGEVSSAIFDRAQAVALRDASFGASGTVLAQSEVATGWINLASSTSAIDTGKPASQFNAVHVLARRSHASANGPVQFFFASIFGKSDGEVSASATAAYDDRVSGYDPGAGGADLLPFTMNLTEYNNQVAAGSDTYDYDSGTDNVYSGKDGVPEVKMYPNNLAPGNFGLVNIGNSNYGTPNQVEDIENGVAPADLVKEIGTEQLTFYDGNGKAVTYSIRGDPGLTASLESSIKTRIGDVVAIAVHDVVTGNGANTKYRVVGIRFARVMGVKLQGSSSGRGLWVQPVSYNGPGVIVNPNAPSSGGVAGRIVLVR